MILHKQSSLGKDSIPTANYELNQYQQREPLLDFSLNFDEINMQQTYLLKLKIQREKMEEIMSLYRQNVIQLKQKKGVEKQLKKEIEKLRQFRQYKQLYVEMKEKFMTESKRNQQCEYEVQELSRQIIKMSQSKQQSINKCKLQIQSLIESKKASQTHWALVISERQQSLKKLNQISKQKQKDMLQTITDLEQQRNQARQLFNDKQNIIESTETCLKNQLKLRDRTINSCNKLVSTAKKQKDQYKIRFEQIQQEKDDLLRMIDTLKHHNKELKKDQSAKNIEICTMIETIAQNVGTIQKLEQMVTNLTTELKNAKTEADSAMKCHSINECQQKIKLQFQIQSLQHNISQLESEKEDLSDQVKKTKGLLRKKEKQFKKKNSLLWNQFKTADKEMKEIKKLV